MSLGWKQWNRSDIIYGIITPVIVVLAIVAISKLDSLFGGGYNAVTGIIMQIQELLVIVAIPLLLGLAWNKWQAAPQASSWEPSTHFTGHTAIGHLSREASLALTRFC